MNDPYAKGWQTGHREAVNDIRAHIVRATPSLTVRLSTGEYIAVEDVLALIDRVVQQTHDPIGPPNIVNLRRWRA